jgi:hypothetical protein
MDVRKASSDMMEEFDGIDELPSINKTIGQILYLMIINLKGISAEVVLNI